MITFILAQFINNPSTAAVSLNQQASKNNNNYKVDYSWSEMLRTRTFYLLWIEFACGAMAGLMIIGHLAKIVAVQSGNAIQIGFIFVALLAIFNAGGRLVAGFASDYIGRLRTVLIVCLSQAVVMFFFSRISTISTFILGSAVVGFSYGACLSLFPSTCADYWGTKNLGLNYGILFTAWGVGGVFGPILAGRIADASGNYNMAYVISASLMIFAAILTFFTKVPEREMVGEFAQPVLARKLKADRLTSCSYPKSPRMGAFFWPIAVIPLIPASRQALNLAWYRAGKLSLPTGDSVAIMMEGRYGRNRQSGSSALECGHLEVWVIDLPASEIFPWAWRPAVYR